MRRLNIFLDDIELGPLLMHHVCDITKQLVELADRLLDIADLGLALDDEGFLEVDLVLVCEAQLLLLLQLVLAVVSPLFAWRGCVLEGGASGLCGLLFFFQRLLLQLLEFGEGGFEFALQLRLSEFLRGLLFLTVS